MISVIIPTYNRANMLGPAIDSVLMQTFQDYEIIVVDDGSIDETPPILDNFSGQIRTICQQNSGPAKARNVGIEAAQGEFIAFLDSDDLWLPEKLAKQIDLMNLHPAVGFCYTQCFDEKDGNRKLGTSRKQSFDELLTAWSRILTSSVLIKKTSLAEVGGFNEQLRGAEDFECWLRLLQKYDGVFLDEPLIVKRLHDANLAMNKTEHVRHRVYIFRELLPQMGLGKEYQPLLKAGQSYFSYLHADYLHHDGKYQAAYAAYIKLLCRCPWLYLRLCT